MSTLTINVPYEKRHLRNEIKHRQGKFDPTSKTWSLPDTADNRQLADLIQKPITAPTPEERVTNIATTMVDLLNATKARQFRLVECSDRIVIESSPLA